MLERANLGEHVDVWSLDVEGFEMPVLRGVAWVVGGYRSGPAAR